MSIDRCFVRLFVCLALLLITGALSGCSPAPTTSAPPPPAEATVKAVDEQEYQLELDKHRGRIILVDFWATWCTPCVEQFPHTVELHKKYEPQGLTVMSMNFDDESAKPEVLAFLKQKGATFQNLISKYGADPKSFDVFDIDGGAVPHYKLYDREGKLVKKFIVDPTADPVKPEDIDLAIRELVTKPVQ